MSDMKQAIIPKSDQLNADDLMTGPITVKITAVTVRGGQEQPVAISYEGDNGKPYKACKSMCRVLVTAWGPDSQKYVGRSMTLYCAPRVKWAGMEVGGIRISHMSDIEAPLTMALTVTRANKKPFTVKPITESAAPQADSSSKSIHEPAEAADLLAKLREEFTACDKLAESAFVKVAKIDSLEKLPAADYADARSWLARRRAKFNAPQQEQQ